MALTKDDLSLITDSLSGLVKRQVEEVMKAVDERAATGLSLKAEERNYAQELMEGALGEPRTPRQRLEATVGVGRMLRAFAASKGDPERASRFAAETWKDSVGQAVSKALGAQDAAAGGFLIPDQWSADIIEFLRPKTVVRKSGPMVIDMPNGTMNIPRIGSGATASYIGENTNLGMTSQQFGNVHLTYKKLGAVIAISNDLLRTQSVSADAVIRNDLVRAMAQAEDLNFLRSDGTVFSPKGIKYWAANTTTSAGTSLANMITDLSKLLLYLYNANVNFTNPAWFMSPRTRVTFETVQNSQGFYVFRNEMMTTGKLWGVPFYSTTQIPINLSGTNTELYLADMDDVVIGEATTLIIDSSPEAAYYDGSAVQSAWSQDQTSVRAISRHDLAARHDPSVAYLSAVAY